MKNRTSIVFLILTLIFFCMGVHVSEQTVAFTTLIPAGKIDQAWEIARLNIELNQIAVINAPLVNNPPEKPGWELVFQDEFDGNELDQSKWTPRWGTYNSENSWANGIANIEVSDGTGAANIEDAYENGIKIYPNTNSQEQTLNEIAFDLLEQQQVSSNYTFVVIGDPHPKRCEDDGSPGYESYFVPILSEIADIDPVFVIIVGDLTDHGNEDATDGLSDENKLPNKEYTQFYNTLSTWMNLTEIPVFSLPGNHDFDLCAFDEYHNKIGEKNFYFDFGDSRFILYNNVQEEVPGWWRTDYKITFDTLDLIESWLMNGPSIKFTFSHIPINENHGDCGDEFCPGYETMFDLNQTYNTKTCFAGHLHKYIYTNTNGTDYFITGGATGGQMESTQYNNDDPYDHLTDRHWLEVNVKCNGGTKVLMHILGRLRNEPLDPDGTISEQFDVYIDNLQYPSNNFVQTKGWNNMNDRLRLMGDINDDGGGDIVGFGYMNTQVSLSTSTGNNSSFSSKYYIFQDYTKEQGWSDNSINPRMLVDVNGDGKKDIIGFDDKTYVSLSTSTSTTASFHSKVGVSIHFGLNKGWSDMDNYPRVMADVNGNGKADIIGFGYSGIQVSLSNSTQTNASFRPKQYVISSYCKTKGWSSNNTHPRMVVDVNGDGKGDIVGFGYNCVYVSLSNSTSTNASFLPKDQIYNEFTIDKGWSNNDKYPRMLADFNGDGKADIIGFGYNGTYVSLSTSTTTDASFGPITWVCPQFAYEQGWTSNEIYPRIVKDINCDNKADIIGFGQRVVKVSLSESGVSNVSFSNYQNVIDNYTEVKGWTSNNEYPRFLADIDNDGSYEIVGFGHNNVITFGFCEDCNH